MPVIVINPNSTAAMTNAMTAAATEAAPDLWFEGWTSTDGPAAIQGPEDGAVATPPLLSLVARAAAAKADGIIIGCFDDTALAEAAAAAPCPVLGIGQAAFHHCALRQWRFGVVTTLPVSVPVIEANIARYGLDGGLTRVHASNVPVLELERAPDEAIAPIHAEAEQACAEGAEAIVLGCAGMVHVTEALRARLPVPVIDPVEAAARAMAWMCPRA